MVLMDRMASDERGRGYSEHLLVWSWRRVASGQVHCPVMAQEFTEACAQAGGEVLLSLCTFLGILTAANRRPLNLCAPDPFGVTSDERQVLTLFAAAQAKDHALFQAHLRWLAEPQRRNELQIAAYTLAATLKVNNLPLARPQVAMPGSSERPRAVM